MGLALARVRSKLSLYIAAILSWFVLFLFWVDRCFDTSDIILNPYPVQTDYCKEHFVVDGDAAFEAVAANCCDQYDYCNVQLMRTLPVLTVGKPKG